MNIKKVYIFFSLIKSNMFFHFDYLSANIKPLTHH
jgi:hypothetical protein